MKKKYWRKYNGAIIPNSPPHLLVQEKAGMIRKRVISTFSFFARWVSDFDCKKVTNFWYVINDTPLEINDYSSNTRSKIRRGLKNFDVKKVKKDEILKNGYKTYKEAYKRYKTTMRPFTKQKFLEHIKSLSKEWEFWGVYTKDNGILVAYSENRVINNQCNYSTIKFHADYLKNYVSYALYFTMNKYYLNEKRIKYVNEGTRSILHQTNVQSFLIDKFKFRKAYCKLHILYHPFVVVFVKILFPFRRFLIQFNFSFFQKVGVVLKQEELRRDPK